MSAGAAMFLGVVILATAIICFRLRAYLKWERRLEGAMKRAERERAGK